MYVTVGDLICEAFIFVENKSKPLSFDLLNLGFTEDILISQ